MATKRAKKVKNKVEDKKDYKESARQWYKKEGFKWIFALVSFLLMYIIYYFSNNPIDPGDTGNLIDPLKHVATTFISSIL